MKRIDTPNATAGGMFQDGDPTTGQPGTEVSAAWLNQVQELLRTPIVSAGYTAPARDQVDLLQLAIRWHAAAVLQPYSQNILGVISAAGLVFDATKSDQLLKSLLLLTHPVGTVEIRYDAIDPGTIYGGTWTQFGAGRVLVGVNAADADFDTIGKTGGAKTHTLTIDEMPMHSHTLPQERGGAINQASLIDTEQSDEGPLGAPNTGSAGGGQPHNNVQPYIVAAFWRRTA